MKRGIDTYSNSWLTTRTIKTKSTPLIKNTTETLCNVKKMEKYLVKALIMSVKQQINNLLLS